MLCLNRGHIHCEKLLKFGEKYDIMNYRISWRFCCICEIKRALSAFARWNIMHNERALGKRPYKTLLIRPDRDTAITHYALRITN